MKKIIAGILAFTTVFTILTGCGKDESSSSEKSSSSSAQSAEKAGDSASTDEDNTNSTEENVTEEDVTEENTETETKENNNSSDSGYIEPSGDYEDFIKDAIENINAENYKELLYSYYPTDVIDTILEYRPDMMDELKEDLDSDGKKIIYKGIISEEKVPDDEIADAGEELAQYAAAAELIKKYKGDVEAIPEEEQEAAMEVRDSRYKITQAYLVDVEIEYEGEEGNPDEMYFLVYYIDGDGWKLEESMVGYVKKSKKTTLNAHASSLEKAFASALTDLDVEGVDLSGKYIISSDDSMNVNAESKPVDKIKSQTKNYFDDIVKIDYFVVIDNGCPIYAVIKNKDDDTYIGTYPAYTLPADINDYSKERDENFNHSYEELYQLAKDLLK
ncbi:MAG: hypothetical protein IJM38_08935 [Ruminococcus sp.]|nr:hypothetical protein [Ruminococcus sp.]